MRHLALAVVLAGVLSGTAWAGEIPSGDRKPSSPGACSQDTAGEISTGALTGEIPTSDATAPEASSTLFTIILTLLTIGR
jgi:hypothetical protein